MFRKKPMSLVARVIATLVCMTVWPFGTMAASPPDSPPSPQQASVSPPALRSTDPALPPPESLILYFDTGRSTVRAQDVALLDQASRLYRDGHPIIMTLTATTDGVGSAIVNLVLSQQRTQAVLRGLVQRGIPADRFELVAKGKIEQAVPVDDGIAEPADRRVEIRWK